LEFGLLKYGLGWDRGKSDRLGETKAFHQMKSLLEFLVNWCIAGFGAIGKQPKGKPPELIFEVTDGGTAWN